MTQGEFSKQITIMDADKIIFRSLNLLAGVIMAQIRRGDTRDYIVNESQDRNLEEEKSLLSHSSEVEPSNVDSNKVPCVPCVP
mgnify:CR=1 FL=1